MKTPEEIKKGLECCTIPLCTECPYDCEASCVVKNEDALAYIQQLEAEVEIREIQKNAMFAKAEQLERERDFLLKYLTDSHWAACDICKHEPEEGNIHACKRIREVKGAPCFEWRGLPEV